MSLAAIVRRTMHNRGLGTVTDDGGMTHPRASSTVEGIRMLMSKIGWIDPVEQAEAQHLPEASLREKEGLLEKRAFGTSDVEWHTRYVILTAEILAFSRVGENEVLDFIPLEEIDEIRHPQNPLVRGSSRGLTRGAEEDRLSSTGRTATGGSQQAYNDASISPKNVSAKGKSLSPSTTPKATPVTAGTTTMAAVTSVFPTLNRKQPQNVDSEAPAAIGEEAFFSQVPHTPDHEANLEPMHEFHVQTKVDGHNSGRCFLLRTASVFQRDEWVASVKTALHKRHRELLALETHKRGEVFRMKVKAVYMSFPMQVIIALCILASFAINIYLVEYFPEPGSETARHLENLDIVLTVMFTLDVFTNLVSHWLVEFVSDYWNILDLAVVVASIVSLASETVKGISSIRLLRAFRVIKLFRQFGAMHRIISAITVSLFPVINAVVILFVVTCIYAILAVHLFKDRNEELFGHFSASIFTMFQCVTGESWASQVVRPLLAVDPADLDVWNSTSREIEGGGEGACQLPTAEINSGYDATVLFFFSSFVIIATIILVNIVVAVLLDEFICSVQRDKDKLEEQKRQLSKKTYYKISGALDPLLTSLAHFNSTQDLSARIGTLYRYLDVDCNHRLSFTEFREGLKKLKVTPRIKLTKEDYDLITDHRALLNIRGEVTRENFEVIIRRQLKLFVQRHIADSMVEAIQQSSQVGTVLFALKLLMMVVDDIKTHQDFMMKKLGLPPPPSNYEGVAARHPMKGDTGSVSGAAGSRSADDGKLEGINERLEVLEKRSASMDHKLDRILAILGGGVTPETSGVAPETGGRVTPDLCSMTPQMTAQPPMSRFVSTDIVERANSDDFAPVHTPVLGPASGGERRTTYAPPQVDMPSSNRDVLQEDM